MVTGLHIVPVSSFEDFEQPHFSIRKNSGGKIKKIKNNKFYLVQAVIVSVLISPEQPASDSDKAG
jgi:hypothetical protein